MEVGTANDCATTSPEPKGTAETPSAAEPAFLSRTAEDTREKTVPGPRSSNSQLNSSAPPTTTAPAPNPEQASAGNFQAPSGDSSARVLKTPHTEARDNGGRPDNGCHETISSATSETVNSRSATGAACSHNTAVTREHAYASLDLSVDEMVAQNWNSAWTSGAANIVLVVSTQALQCGSPVDLVTQVPATPASALQRSDSLPPVSTSRFQHAPADSHSVSLNGNAVTSATGGNGGPDERVLLVYRRTALPPANNVSNSSNDSAAERRRSVCASYPIMTSLLKDKQCSVNDQSTRTTRQQDIPQTPPTHSTTGGHVQPSEDLTRNGSLEQAHDDLPTSHRSERNDTAERRLTRVGGHRDVLDARQAWQQTNGGVSPSYNRASSASVPLPTGAAQPKPAPRPRSALAGTVTQPDCSSGSDSLVASRESVSHEQNALMKPKQGALLERSSPPRISLPVADDDVPSLESFFQEHKTIPLHLWKAGSTEQISGNSVPIPESLSTETKASMEPCQTAARLNRSSGQQSSSPPSDDSVPSLESLSPDQMLSMESTTEATLPRMV
ncbi:hypothetical protein HPB50_012557 [Hyalomma asiaticum]|uniref:Uncharacterized protein n=1 Tax=Hyalomma asiaticum TaxID=266040 RepID=A0ACB7RQP0_HYAAI|nr:hypothetical protein HPB50_012557 [Hyalomma asiaticum]